MVGINASHRLTLPKLLCLGSVAAFFSVATGCGSSESSFERRLDAADNLYRKELQALNELADACERHELKTKRAEIAARVADLVKQREALSVTDEMQLKLDEKYLDKVRAVSQRLLP